METFLIRTYHPQGTNGSWYINGAFICHTIELPWRHNLPKRSCIPEGRYRLRQRWSRRFGWHLWLENVPGRSLILVHPANDALNELRGCIAPVLQLTGPGKGAGSRTATRALWQGLKPALIENSIFVTIKS